MILCAVPLFRMEETTVVIKLRDEEVLCVQKQRLTENSSVFRHLINNLGLHELELDDFIPETVTLFMTVLADKTLHHFEDVQFRELHKISVVFKVKWLVRLSRDWLIGRINQMEDNSTSTQDQLFLFNECLYILNYWYWDNTFLTTLNRQVIPENNRQFITYYISEQGYQNLTKNEINLILILAGSEADIVCSVLYHQITVHNADKQSLDDATRYFLQHINLPLCYERNEFLCDEIFHQISNMENLSADDSKLILRMITAARKEITKRKINSSTAFSHSNTREFRTEDSSIKIKANGKNRKLIRNDSINRKKVTELIAKGGIRNMYVVVDLLSRTIDLVQSAKQSEEFVQLLEKLSRKNSLQRISPHYIDMIIEALQFSHKGEKDNCVYLLTLIKGNSSLTSSKENECLIGNELTSFPETSKLPKKHISSKVKEVFGKKKSAQSTNHEQDEANVSKCMYKFSKSARTKFNCKINGDCGFILKHTKDQHFVEHELCKDSSHYIGTGTHTHDNIRMEDMFWYVIESAELSNGGRVQVPVRWRKGKSWEWKRWFKVDSEWQLDEYRVDYNMMNSSNKVAKL